MRHALFSLATLLAGCENEGTKRSALPDLPNADLVRKLVADTGDLLGPTFAPVFVCGQSQGQSFQPSRSGSAWTDGQGAAAVVIAVDENGALEVLKLANAALVAVTVEGGMVVPVKFDPLAGEIAVAVAYPKSGIAETYTFTTFEKGPSFLTSTVNLPLDTTRKGDRGVQAFIAQCVEIPVAPVKAAARG